LEKRAKAIFDELKDRIELKHKEYKKGEDLKELLLAGENEKLEMKSTMRFDIREGKINSKMEYIVAKSISSFLNSEGGTLIIGVDDNGNVLGLEKDYQTLTKQNPDGFQLHLRQIIKKYLGYFFEKYITISFPHLDGKEICVLQISKSGRPVFVTYEGNEFFFVRNGNSSIPKNRREQSEYEKLHWKSK